MNHNIILDHGNNMATKNQIATEIWIADIMEILQAKSPNQNRLSYGFQGRVGIMMSEFYCATNTPK
jgi:hypothetical protein